MHEKIIAEESSRVEEFQSKRVNRILGWLKIYMYRPNPNSDRIKTTKKHPLIFALSRSARCLDLIAT